MNNDIANFNLSKDKNVLGEKWTTTYNGYFSDEENLETFADSLLPHLPKKPLNILYVASASGALGEALLERLGEGTLTLVDFSSEHLNANKNPKTVKVESDLLNLDLNKKFDLIIMRSSLDYFPSTEKQVEVLANVKRHLIDGGIFVNQPAFVPDLTERDMISKAYTSTEKIGDRLFQSSDLPTLYNEAGFNKPIKIGAGKTLELTEKEHVERYEINSGDIKNVQSCIKNCVTSASITKDGYYMEFEFPIFLSSPS